MLQKPEEVWGKGAGSPLQAAPTGLGSGQYGHAPAHTNQPVSHGVTAKTMSICPLYGHGVFVLGDLDLALHGQEEGKLCRQPCLSA